MLDAVTSLVNAALADVHGSWLPELDAALLQKARASAVGRRWLAASLSSLELFNRPPALLGLEAGPLLASNWWQYSLQLCSQPLLEIGAFTFIPVIRAAVLREQVLQWRRVLGRDTYLSLLKNSDAMLQENVIQAAFQPDSNIVADDALLTERIRKTACFELLSYASAIHPLLRTRVALAFPQCWSEEHLNHSYVPCLPSEFLSSRLDQMNYTVTWQTNTGEA